MAAKKKYDEKRMPFLEHLEELRWHIFRSFISVFVLTVVFFFFSEELLDFLTSPYPDKLITLGPTEPFMIRMKIAFFAALIVSIPILVREIWAFVAPGLLENERKHVPMLIFLTSFCFLLGASFAFFVVLPLTIKFLLGYQTEKMQASTAMSQYLSFVTRFMLGFGAVFELPVLSMVLTRIGIISPELMKKYRSYAIVTIFILAAVLTPSTDALTQLLLAGPMLVLYEISILLAKMIAKKKRLQEEQEEREYEAELKEEAKKRAAQKKEALIAESKKSEGKEELKKWETEGDHYEEPESKDSGARDYGADDVYPYDMDHYDSTPKGKDTQKPVEAGPDEGAVPYDESPMEDYYDKPDEDGNATPPESDENEKKDNPGEN